MPATFLRNGVGSLLNTAAATRPMTANINWLVNCEKTDPPRMYDWTLVADSTMTRPSRTSTDVEPSSR